MNNASQNQNSFNIGSVGTFNTGDVTIHGDQVGIQNNYTTNPEIQPVITQLQELLNTLQTQNPNITNETEALAIIDAEFTEIQTTPGHRYSNLLSSLKQLGKQVFNLENQLQAGKATLAEVAKHYLEESVLSKAAITYLEALSEAPDQGA